jgi:hypothetical protein
VRFAGSSLARSGGRLFFASFDPAGHGPPAPFPFLHEAYMCHFATVNQEMAELDYFA